jgi:hypothetical protein
MMMLKLFMCTPSYLLLLLLPYRVKPPLHHTVLRLLSIFFLPLYRSFCYNSLPPHTHIICTQLFILFHCAENFWVVKSTRDFQRRKEKKKNFFKFSSCIKKREVLNGVQGNHMYIHSR